MQNKVSVAMLGARMHYAVPRILCQAGMLEQLFTDSYIGNKPWLESVLRVIPKKMRPAGINRLLDRKESHIPKSKVTSFESLGWWYAIRRSRIRNVIERENIHVKAGRKFNLSIIKHGLGNPGALWAYNIGAKELFEEASRSGINCIYEQTILPRKLEIELLREEVERWPGWEPGLELPESSSPIAEREEAEWELSDIILVGSNFVRDGLVSCGVDVSRIHVVPYGVHLSDRVSSQSRGANFKRPLRLLFAGMVGLRKGVPYLLEAFKRVPVGMAELRIAGQITINKEHLAGQSNSVKFLGHVPRGQMPALFEWADVFVLPSIIEGSATVTYEALCYGVPVITTPNAGSIVRDGVDGRVVPIRNTELLAEAIQSYAVDRDMLRRHQEAAKENGIRATIERYSRDLLSILEPLLTSNGKSPGSAGETAKV